MHCDTNCEKSGPWSSDSYPSKLTIIQTSRCSTEAEIVIRRLYIQCDYLCWDTTFSLLSHTFSPYTDKTATRPIPSGIRVQLERDGIYNEPSCAPFLDTRIYLLFRSWVTGPPGHCRNNFPPPSFHIFAVFLQFFPHSDSQRFTSSRIPPVHFCDGCRPSPPGVAQCSDSN